MRAHAVPAVLAAALAVPAAVSAHEPHWDRPGTMVEVSVEVEGSGSPLYAAPDGSGRYYFEARRGARYSSGWRTARTSGSASRCTVDGLNVISGEQAAPGAGRHRPGRMYVLDPWDQTEVKGWRTSLDEVRRFTFVDEQRSYAARSGKANSKMGWVEVAVYRERGRSVGSYWPWRSEPDARDRSSDERKDAPEPTARSASGGERSGRAQCAQGRGQGRRHVPTAGAAYPGTGWGQRDGRPRGRGGLRAGAQPGRAHHAALRVRERPAGAGHRRAPALDGRPAARARPRPGLREAAGLVGPQDPPASSRRSASS